VSAEVFFLSLFFSLAAAAKKEIQGFGVFFDCCGTRRIALKKLNEKC
jgi:hypothetical protein